MKMENSQIATTAFLALPVVTMIWCCNGRVNKIALSPDIRVIVHTEAIRNVYVSITNTAHEAGVHRSGPMKLFRMLSICRGIAAFIASAIDRENNSKSAMFHGLYRHSVVRMSRCPPTKNVITTSTTSPKVGLAWNRAGGTLAVVVAFSETPGNKEATAEVGRSDIASKKLSTDFLNNKPLYNTRQI